MFFRTGLFSTVFLGLAALSLACGDDSGTKPPKTDQKVTLADSGTPDQKVTTPDQKVTTGDQKVTTGDGSTTNATCLDILSCISKCSSGDTTCMTNCSTNASTDAKTKFTAYMTCVNKAVATGGACASKCTNRTSSDCVSCVGTACKTEYDTCTGGGGPPVAGFGDLCDQTKTCKTGFECISLQSGTSGKGFCTKKCTTQGAPCSGAATGQNAACVISGTSGSTTVYYCGFICLYQGTSYTCPTGLTCKAATGGSICVP